MDSRARSAPAAGDGGHDPGPGQRRAPARSRPGRWAAAITLACAGITGLSAAAIGGTPLTPLGAGPVGVAPAITAVASAYSRAAPRETYALAPDPGLDATTVAAGPRLSVPEQFTVPGSLATALPWPPGGQSAVAVDALGIRLGSGPAAAVPIASVAKVMTAYLVLRHHPLAAGQAGPTITVLPAEAAAYPGELAHNESVVRIVAGEQLTEQQALQALLIASADNVAQLLARWDAGSAASFVTAMNAAAAGLGMAHTRYTDPSGLDSGTVSTAADQLLLAREAMTLPALARIVSQRDAVIPVAGTITNYNSLLGSNGVIGIKTGSTLAAGGCLLFAAGFTVDGRNLTVIGAVLAQPGALAAVLPNVLSRSRALIAAIQATIRPITLLRAGQQVAQQGRPSGPAAPLVLARDVTVLGWPGLDLRLSLVRHGADRPPSLRVLAGTDQVDVPLATAPG